MAIFLSGIAIILGIDSIPILAIGIAVGLLGIVMFVRSRSATPTASA